MMPPLRRPTSASRYPRPRPAAVATRVAYVATRVEVSGSAVAAHAAANVVAAVTMSASAGRELPTATHPVAAIATTAPMTVPATDSTRRGRPARRAISA